VTRITQERENTERSYASDKEAKVTTAVFGSMLLASIDADQLRNWYERAFDVKPNAGGFLEFGGTDALFDARRDVAVRNPEPQQTILHFHVDDAHTVAAHLNTLDVRWLVEVEFRGDAWLGTLLDPDGNCIQIIEPTDASLAARQ
jgi:hypothetical protein